MDDIWGVTPSEETLWEAEGQRNEKNHESLSSNEETHWLGFSWN